MSRLDWERVEEILGGALKVPRRDREAFVSREVGDDPELAAEVVRLVEASEGADGYIDGLRKDLLGADLPDLVAGEGHASFGDSDPWIGRTVSHYRILDHLGDGATGVVYRAHDLSLDRHVALKFLAPEIGRDQAARERFMREARTASSMDHPNICTIHEISETDDARLFIVMPAYEGETLRSRLKGGAIHRDEAIDLAHQVALALGAAHARGIVHGDVKPDNVFVTESGRVKLLDFGLAGAVDDAGTERTGGWGTIPYMSPERARGEPGEARSDVWAAGVILYEMLAGRRPFSADEPSAVLDLILRHTPELSVELPDIPSALARVVARTLAPQPEERFQDGTAMAEALMASLASRPGVIDRLLAGVRLHPRPAALGILVATSAVVWGWRAGAAPGDGITSTHAVEGVLWVDDNPENNSAVIMRLRENGIEVTTSLGTADALTRYDPSRHQLLVSDMGRYEGENGEYVGRAGLELLNGLRARNEGVQLMFCTSFRAAAEYREEALAAGAIGIVADCDEVLRLVGL